MTWIKWMLLALALFAIAFIALAAYGSVDWNERTRELMARLEATRVPPRPARYDARELDGLPAPVQRYFRTALSDGARIVSAVTVAHAGSFNMGETADRWKPFTSTQRVVTRAPGFVWDGRVVMLPGLAVQVHDAYVGGTGILQPALLGLFTLADLHGTGDIAQGELMRFFAEAAWYPTALLPSQGARWQALDERSARATLSDGSLTLDLSFEFNDAGLIESVRAEARCRTVGNQTVPAPWEGRWSDYQTRDGMRVPMRGEVAWLLPEGRKPYWRGTITSLHYEFAD